MMKKHNLIYLIIGTFAIAAYIFTSGLNLDKDLEGFYKGILSGWIIAAWAFFLLKKKK